MMPVLSSVSAKSPCVGKKTFQSGITYAQLGAAAVDRAGGKGHVSIYQPITKKKKKTSDKVHKKMHKVVIYLNAFFLLTHFKKYIFYDYI